jgi:uncharacterized protein
MDDFTMRAAVQWKIGQGGKDNGVILFASKNDRRMRIEAGRGLEGVLTDLLAGRILDNVISPQFREGNFDGGFTAGIEAIIQACRGEFKNDKTYEEPKQQSGLKYFLKSQLFILFLIFIFILLSRKKGSGSGLSPGSSGGFSGSSGYSGGGGFSGGGFSGGGGSFGGGGASGGW